MDIIKNLHIDLGQGCFRHTTKAKMIAFSLAGKGRGCKVLDLGCGDGYWSERLSEQGWGVVSADLDNCVYQHAIRVDAETSLPFDDDVFDLIWSAEVIEHVCNIEGLIKEMCRVVKPGGRLILTTPNSFFWLYYFLGWFGVTPKQAQNPDHKHFFSISDIRSLLPEAAVLGFFPYNVLKFKIGLGVGFLSPTFVISVVVK